MTKEKTKELLHQIIEFYKEFSVIKKQNPEKMREQIYKEKKDWEGATESAKFCFGFNHAISEIEEKDKEFWESEENVSQLLEKYELLKRELSGRKAVVVTKEQELNKDVAFLMEMFKEVNPSYVQLFKHKPQRESIKRLLEKMAFDKLAELIDLLQQTNQMQYAPVITTPSQLESKLGALIAFISREKVARKTNENIAII